MSPERLGLYGMMLGLCGQPEDAEFLREQIGDPKPAKEFRFGTEGIMGGYLLLAGEDGLSYLEETRLKPTGVDYTEHFAVMQAVQFIWSYESDVISKPGSRKACITCSTNLRSETSPSPTSPAGRTGMSHLADLSLQ